MVRRALLKQAKAFAQEHLPAEAREAVRSVYRRVRRDFYPYESWSQTGEDLILRATFRGVARGFYVDVGAAHPKFGSNTYLLYKRGWNGINVDAAPGAMKAFRRVRPRDTNLEVGIADRPGEMSFFMFADDPGLNTFDEELAKERSRRHHIDRVVKVRTSTLASLLAEHAPRSIDLLAVDCEGFDERVLRSNDWTRFRPSVLLVESLSGGALQPGPVQTFLEAQGYAVFARTPMNLFLRDTRR